MSRTVDLNLVDTFVQVLDRGGVERAARALGRTQPAVSARIRQLEELFQAPLFERAGRRLVLSPAGRSLEAPAREVLALARELLDQARTSAGGGRAILRIGALPTVSAYLLAPAIAKTLAASASVRIEMRLGITRPLIDELMRGDLDAVFSVGPVPPERSLRFESLARTRPVLVGGAKRRIAKGPVDAAKLASIDLVTYGKTGDAFFDEVDAFLRRHRIRSLTRVEAPHILTLKSLVIAGCGCTVLPDYTVVEESLWSRPIQGLRVAHPIWVATRAPGIAWKHLADLVAQVRAEASSVLSS